MSIYYCCFSPKVLTKYLQRIKSSFPQLASFLDGSFPQYLQIRDNHKNELRNLFVQMIDEFTYVPAGADYMLECLLVQLLTRIFRRFLNQESVEHMYCSNKTVDEIILYIEQKLNSKLSLELIAKHAHLSTGYMSALFKQHTGLTIIQFINKLRVDKIKYLLVNTTRPVDMIATDFISNPKYLNRLFKKYTGSTLNAYREKYRD